MAVIKAFFDDSGTHDGSPVMVVGGCAATIAAWDAFTMEWSEHLISWGLDWFHMAEAEGKRAGYSQWTNDDRDARVGILARLLSKTVLCNLGVVQDAATLKNQLLDRIKQEVPEMALTEGDPYHYAFLHVLIGLGRVCEQAGIDRSDVEIVFAEQRGIGPRTLDAWRKDIREMGFPEPVFRSPQKLIPLQGADMVAWFLRHQFDQMLKGRTGVRLRHQPLTHNLIYSPVGEGMVAKLSAAFDEAKHYPDDSDAR